MAEYTLRFPELADRDPRSVPRAGDGGTAQAGRRGTGRWHGGRLSAPATRSRSRPVGWAIIASSAKWRGRHGGRLRGRAGVAGPARCPQGPARGMGGSARPRSSGSGSRPARRRDCITATSSRSTAWANTRACITTQCNSSRVTAWMRSSTTCGGFVGWSPARRFLAETMRARPWRPAGPALWPWPARS